MIDTVKRDDILDLITSAAQEIFDSIENMPSANDWCPVNRRVPVLEYRWNKKGKTDYSYPCMVTINEEFVEKGYFMEEDEKRIFIDAGGNDITEYVTAWMHMPKPYKEMKNV